MFRYFLISAMMMLFSCRSTNIEIEDEAELSSSSKVNSSSSLSSSSEGGEVDLRAHYFYRTSIFVDKQNKDTVNLRVATHENGSYEVYYGQGEESTDVDYYNKDHELYKAKSLESPYYSFEYFEPIKLLADTVILGERYYDPVYVKAYNSELELIDSYKVDYFRMVEPIENPRFEDCYKKRTFQEIDALEYESFQIFCKDEGVVIIGNDFGYLTRI